MFTDEELKAEFSQAQTTFDKIQTLRTAFATKLKASKISKEEVLQHFAETDKLMEELRKTSQEKAAQKISTLTDEQRVKFAEQLEHEHHPGPGL